MQNEELYDKDKLHVLPQLGSETSLEVDLSITPTIPENLSKLNTLAILKVLMKYHSISRAKISNITNISKATVTRLSKDLVTNGFVIETEKGKSQGGRKPQIIELNPDKAFFIGVDVGSESSRISLFDLSMKSRTTSEFSTDNNPDSFVKSLAREINSMLFHFKPIKIESVVVSVPGIVNHDLTQIRWLPELGWKEVDLSRRLTTELLITGLKTHAIVENSGNLAVIAESMMGKYVNFDDKNVVFLMIAKSLEMGLILNGKLYTGRTNTAGEFGHTMISRDGRECDCGRKGCWATYSTAQEEKVNGYLDYTEILSEGIVNIVNAVDPDLIIIGGNIVKRWNEFYPKIWAHVEKYALPYDIKGLQLVPTSFAPLDAPLIGTGLLGFWNFVTHSILSIKD